MAVITEEDSLVVITSSPLCVSVSLGAVQVIKGSGRCLWIYIKNNHNKANSYREGPITPRGSLGHVPNRSRISSQDRK